VKPSTIMLMVSLPLLIACSRLEPVNNPERRCNPADKNCAQQTLPSTDQGSANLRSHRDFMDEAACMAKRNGDRSRKCDWR
jgi:hypothetical protein